MRKWGNREEKKRALWGVEKKKKIFGRKTGRLPNLWNWVGGRQKGNKAARKQRPGAEKNSLSQGRKKEGKRRKLTPSGDPVAWGQRMQRSQGGA